MKTLWSIEILCIFVCVQYYRNVVVQSGDILISGIQLWPALLMCSPQSLMLFLWAKRNFYCIIICFPLNYSQLGTCILHCVRSLWDRGLLGSWRSTGMEEVEHLLLATFYEFYKKAFNAYNSLLKWGERNPKRDWGSLKWDADVLGSLFVTVLLHRHAHVNHSWLSLPFMHHYWPVSLLQEIIFKKNNINTAKCDSEAESFFHATLTVTVPYKWKRVEGGIGAIKNEVRNQSLS